MGRREIERYCALDQASELLIKNAMNRLNLSARAYDRILKVARTIANLSSSEQITSSHIAEAIQYRSLDRDFWSSSG